MQYSVDVSGRRVPFWGKIGVDGRVRMGEEVELQEVGVWSRGKGSSSQGVLYKRRYTYTHIHMYMLFKVPECTFSYLTPVQNKYCLIRDS